VAGLQLFRGEDLWETRVGSALDGGHTGISTIAEGPASLADGKGGNPEALYNQEACMQTST
ncbi:hypothetical protein, partial [Acinetobacter baumannii]|uniref:hypothetical protein n=1 Tax=Acinetobacter baumannii TaxID=470 RepID=UPI0037D2509C